MALKNITEDERGAITEYHRIDNVEYNFEQNTIHFDLLGYANKEYRDLEIKHENYIKEQYKRYNELDTILEGKEATEEDVQELNAIPINEILSWKEHRPIYSYSITHYTIPVISDIRESIYNALEQEPLFNGGEEI